ncbi:MAG: hypothetical protein J5802_06195 [Butyrivibrio sp.]|nr:hypothetical protein [Butyrivibrio sp.]
MKEKLGKLNVFVLAAVIALGVMVAVCILNLLLYYSIEEIIGIPYSGGEVTGTTGFGMVLEHYYSLSPDAGETTSLSFSLLSAIISYVVLYVISFFIAKGIKDSQ